MHGAQGRNRTTDTVIFSHWICAAGFNFRDPVSFYRLRVPV
jgi:hypothetical protein